MAENFYTILTAVGKSKLANSAVLGNKVNLKTLQLGDGGGTYHEPSEDQTSLINKVWEGEISSISVDEANSNWIVMQTIIPATDGGFYIREAGVFDEEGDLIAVSKVSETYKPVVSEGSTKDVSIKIVLEVSNVDNIILKIDPNVVVATRNDVEILEAEMQNTNTKISDIDKIKANQSDLDATNANLVMKADDTDSTRTTTLKNVTGAINELNTNKANKDGTLQTNLNADMLDGKHGSDFSLVNHDLMPLVESESDKNFDWYSKGVNYHDHYSGHSRGSYRAIVTAKDDDTGLQISANWCIDEGNLPNDIAFRVKRDMEKDWSNWKQLSTNDTSTFPTFLNGWTFWSDSAYGARQFTKVGNLCNIDVMIMNSSPNNSPIFIIAAGFRPLKSMVICGVSNSTLIPIDIYLDGTVRVKSTLPASNAWVHINATYPVA